MYFLKEKNEFEEIKGKILTEKAQDGKKNYYIEGVFMMGDKKNRNGRVYPFEILKEATDKYIKEELLNNRAVGELDHPNDRNDINFERACIKIEGLRPEGSNIIGKAKVLASEKFPCGMVVSGLIDEGISFGVSSRALGSLNENKVVGNDLQIITAADVVSCPSAHDAYVTAIMEGYEWVWNAGKLYQEEFKVKNYINKSARTGLSEAKLADIFKYTTSLMKSQ